LEINDIFDKDILERTIDIGNENFRDIIYVYTLALKEMLKRIEIIQKDYEYFNEHTSIDHIMNRIKSPDSIVNKMKKDKVGLNYKAMIDNVNDIAGIRVICPLKSDVFTVRKYLREFNDIEVIKEKDYVTHPKPSGYTSYHMILKVPVYIKDRAIKVKVEVQIRSLAMDFWASLEHKIKYKPNGEINEEVSKELIKCARDINKLDNKMVKLFKSKT
jgi:putative GTP pyrophosphokinase